MIAARRRWRGCTARAPLRASSGLPPRPARQLRRLLAALAPQTPRGISSPGRRSPPGPSGGVRLPCNGLQQRCKPTRDWRERSSSCLLIGPPPSAATTHGWEMAEELGPRPGGARKREGAWLSTTPGTTTPGTTTPCVRCSPSRSSRAQQSTRGNQSLVTSPADWLRGAASEWTPGGLRKSCWQPSR